MYTLAAPLTAYPYVQYNDDDNIVAFFLAFNTLGQQYVDFFNTYNLADYNSANISGELLDWCATGIYGVPRPYLVSGAAGETRGPYGLGAYGTLPYGSLEVDAGTVVSYSFVTDDIYRRVITWNFFKGDGKQFTIGWLKRRVERFLSGVLFPDNTEDVSVAFTAPGAVTITIPAANALSVTLQALVASNIVNLPFQYAFTVAVV